MNSDCQNQAVNPESFSACSLTRRCAAMIYDFILLAGVVFIAWLPMPLLSEFLNPVVDRVIRWLYLLFACFFYFAWPWCRGGQTLGMRSWHIRLINAKHPDRQVTLMQAWLRFAGSMLSWAALGAGFMISIFHPQQLAWHDLMSGTRIIRLPGSFRAADVQEPQHKNR